MPESAVHWLHYADWKKQLEAKDEAAIDIAIQKILLMQAHSFFLGGYR